MYGVIYKATNTINQKVYVGQTTQELWARKSHHKHCAVNGVTDNIFSRAIRKYGFENFDWEIIDHANERDDLNRKEIYWIRLNHSHGTKGYNETVGGEGTSGYQIKDTTKIKISETRLKRMDSYAGTKLTTETIVQIKLDLMSEKYTQVDLSNKYNTSSKNIGNIKTRHRRKGVFVEGFDEWSENTNGHSVRVKNQSKLNEEKVKIIKYILLENSMSHRDIADMFNVTVDIIENIKYGKAWKNVKI